MLMNLFRRTPQVDASDPQVPLEIHEAPEQISNVEWGPKPDELTGFRLDKATIPQPPKPDELTRAAYPHATHWETLTPAVLHWSDSPPNSAGLWWYRVKGLPQVRQVVVVDFGGKLCVRFKQGDAVRYTSVAVLERTWCGPCAVPPDVALDELEWVA